MQAGLRNVKMRDVQAAQTTSLIPPAFSIISLDIIARGIAPCRLLLFAISDNASPYLPTGEARLVRPLAK